MKEILENWKINYEHSEEIQRNVWEINSEYYLKSNKNAHWIDNLSIYRALYKVGIPVPEVVRSKDGKAYVRHNETYYFLTRKIEGEHLKVEQVVNDEELAKSVGEAIYKLHKGFSIITTQFSFRDTNLIEELNGWIKDSLEKNASESYTYGILEECLKDLLLADEGLKRHLIHRDMHLGNLLFSNKQITGYIDFDLSQVNARIFDVAYFLVGWTVDKVNDQEYMNKWKKAVRAVIKGYQVEGALSKTELDVLGTMMCCIEILFVGYFYRIEDRKNAVKAEESLKWLYAHKENLLKEDC